MKIVLDNIIFSLQRAGGISGMWANLISRFMNNPELDITFIEYPNACDNIFRSKLNISEHQIELRDYRFHKNLERFMPLNYEMAQKHIFHSSYYRYSKNRYAHNVTTIHDFTYAKVKVRSCLVTFLHSLQKRLAFNNSDSIVCVSNNTWNDYKSLYPKSKSRKIIIGNAPICKPHYTGINSCPSNYLLYVGDRHSYKNFPIAIDVAANVCKRLVICGAQLTTSEKKILNQKLGVDGWVFYLYPVQELLSELYHSAFCLLYPSSYEGFGIPILEAQQHSCPVIAMAGSSIVEVAGNNYPLIAKSYSINEISELIYKLEDKQFRDKAIKLGIENSQRFSWDDIADCYMHLYQELLL